MAKNKRKNGQNDIESADVIQAPIDETQEATVPTAAMPIDAADDFFDMSIMDDMTIEELDGKAYKKAKKDKKHKKDIELLEEPNFEDLFQDQEVEKVATPVVAPIKTPARANPNKKRNRRQKKVVDKEAKCMSAVPQYVKGNYRRAVAQQYGFAFSFAIATFFLILFNMVDAGNIPSTILASADKFIYLGAVGAVVVIGLIWAIASCGKKHVVVFDGFLKAAGICGILMVVYALSDILGGNYLGMKTIAALAVLVLALVFWIIRIKKFDSSVMLELPRRHAPRNVCFFGYTNAVISQVGIVPVIIGLLLTTGILYIRQFTDIGTAVYESQVGALGNDNYGILLATYAPTIALIFMGLAGLFRMRRRHIGMLDVAILCAIYNWLAFLVLVVYDLMKEGGIEALIASAIGAVLYLLEAAGLWLCGVCGAHMNDANSLKLLEESRNTFAEAAGLDKEFFAKTEQKKEASIFSFPKDETVIYQPIETPAENPMNATPTQDTIAAAVTEVAAQTSEVRTDIRKKNKRVSKKDIDSLSLRCELLESKLDVIINVLCAMSDEE